MQVTLIGNKKGIYIDPRNNNAFINWEKAKNIKQIKMFGVNHLVVRRFKDESLLIVQAGGYNRFRGLFVDSYCQKGDK